MVDHVFQNLKFKSEYGGIKIIIDRLIPRIFPGPESHVNREQDEAILDLYARMAPEAKALGGRVAIVGTGHRAEMFVRGIVPRPSSTVVAICEPNSIRAGV